MDKWIPVLVRLDYLAQVNDLIAKLESDYEGGGQPAATPEIVQTTATGGAEPLSAREAAMKKRGLWSIEDLTRLANSPAITAQRWVRAMDVCAQEPGVYLSTTEVAKRSGMSINEWRDAPRKMTRHLKAHYPNVPRNSRGQAYWPLHAWGAPEVSWAMSPKMAELWKQVRSAQA